MKKQILAGAALAAVMAFGPLTAQAEATQLRPACYTTQQINALRAEMADADYWYRWGIPWAQRMDAARVIAERDREGLRVATATAWDTWRKNPTAENYQAGLRVQDRLRAAITEHENVMREQSYRWSFVKTAYDNRERVGGILVNAKVCR